VIREREFTVPDLRLSSGGDGIRVASCCRFQLPLLTRVGRMSSSPPSIASALIAADETSMARLNLDADILAVHLTICVVDPKIV
jgi:hypothetical protein